MLRRQVVLHARVVNPNGKPVARVPLRLGRNGASLSTGPSQFTDANGEARIVVPQYLRSEKNGFCLTAPVGLARDPLLTFAKDSRPSEPQILQLPPTGLVRVIAYGDDEKPRTDVSGVVLNVEPPLGMLGLQGRAEPSGALVRVALGLTFRAHVTLRGVTGNFQGTCKGPTQPDELVVCDVRGTQGPAVLTFIVLGIDGEPVRNDKLGCAVVSTRWSRGSELLSDGSGRVQVALPEQRPEDLQVAIVRRGEPPRDVSGLPQTLYEGGAVVELPPLHPGQCPREPVRLVEEPIWFGGTVLDDDGQPIANSTVSCQPGWTRQAGGFSFSGRQGFFEHQVRTDAQGRFVVRDVMPLPEVQVHAHPPDPGRAPAQQKIIAGTLDAKFMLPRTGLVTLTLEGLPRTNHGLLEGSVEPAGGGQEIQRFGVRDEKTVLQLPAGRYDIVLRVDDRAAEEWRIGNVEVQAGSECADERLRSATWREHFTLVVLAVKDTAGKAVEESMVWLLVPNRTGGMSGGGGRTDAQGRIALLLPKQGAGLNVEGRDDLRGELLENITTDQDVILRPRLAIALDLDGNHGTPAEVQTQFQLMHKGLTLLEERIGTGGRGELQKTAADRLTTTVNRPGVYELVMMVAERLDAGTRLHRFSWGEIEVLEQEKPQSYRCSMSDTERARLDALLERLKQ